MNGFDEVTWAPPLHRAESPHSSSGAVNDRLGAEGPPPLSCKELSSSNSRTKANRAAAQQARYLSPSPAPSSRLSSEPRRSSSPLNGHYVFRPRQSDLRTFWARNKGAILVAMSQFFAALMNLGARLLEVEGEGMHPMQVLLLRQSITSVCCLTYMWWMKTPDGPFGRKDVRHLLFIRGFVGFFGIYG